MTKKNLHIKLQMLLNEFSLEHKLDSSEISTISTTIITLVYSNKSTRFMWYKELQKTANLIADNLYDQGEILLNSLNLSNEEKKALRNKINSKTSKPKKIEN